MSLHIATTSDREHVCTEAQRARAAEQSRHDISKLALELLQQRHNAQHLTNVETRQQGMAYADTELERAAAELIAKHDREDAKSEDAKFALFEEFDTKRQAWAAAASKTTTELLAEEGLKHTALVEALMVEKLSDNRDARKALQIALQEVKQSSVRYPQYVPWYQRSGISQRLTGHAVMTIS